MAARNVKQHGASEAGLKSIQRIKRAVSERPRRRDQTTTFNTEKVSSSCIAGSIASYKPFATGGRITPEGFNGADPILYTVDTPAPVGSSM